jgi:flagellar biosynthetic protein FlhB
MADGQDNDDTSKTEDPTPRKLEESRKKGQIAVSREVSAWLLLLASTVAIGTMLTRVFGDLSVDLKRYLAQAHDLPTGPGGIASVLAEATMNSLWFTLPVFGILILAAFLGPFAQVGPLFAPEILKFDLQKISPLKGMERLFSIKSLIEFAKGLVKITTVSVVTYFVLIPYLDGTEHFVGLDMASLLHELLAMTLRLMIAVAIVMLLFAGLDLAYQRYDFYKRMRMTTQELKDEYRQTEGDPIMRGRLKQLRLEKSRQRMMQNVPKADVVITNPTHFAVALQYIPEEMLAPKVIAKGADDVAARIRQVAKDHAIEIVENPPLARALFDKVDLDQTIPTDLYKAVAEIITYVFKKTGKMKK